MKGVVRYALLGMVLTFLFAGCSKQPVEDINAAKSAVDAAIGEGAEKYSPDEARKLNEDLAAAMNEVTAQDAKFLKDYKKAQEMLIKVRAEADGVKTGLPAKKEEARKGAVAAAESSINALDETKAVLAKAAKKKGLPVDMNVVSTEVRSLDDPLADVQKLIAAEDYKAAVDKANAIKDRAVAIEEQLNEALAKAPEVKAKPSGKTKVAKKR